MKKTAEANLVISVVFLVAFGLGGGAPGVTDRRYAPPGGAGGKTN